MSKYTTQVRWLVEQATPGMVGQNMIDRIIAACPKIFNFDYPIWTPDYRTTLEKKIVMHYFTREIGFETVAIWKLYLAERLGLIMPYYNELYRTTVMDYDPLTDTKSEETFISNKNRTEQADYSGSGHTDRNAASTSDETTNSRHESEDIITGHVLDSDLPQANYNNLDYGTDLKESQTNDNLVESTDGTRAVKVSNHETLGSTTSSKNSVGSNEDEAYRRLRSGNFGSRSFTELMMQYRASLINIDEMVVNELKDLFMTIY